MDSRLGAFLSGLGFGLVLFACWGAYCLLWSPHYWGIWDGWHRQVTKVLFPLFYFSHDSRQASPDMVNMLLAWGLAAMPYGILGFVISLFATGDERKR